MSDFPKTSEGMLDCSGYYGKPMPEEAHQYIMQQTMYRIKNPGVSLDFYINTLGMTLIYHKDVKQWGFTVYFLALGVDPNHIGSLDEEARRVLCMKTPGCIELTWNHGSESEASRVYNTGNSDEVGCDSGKAVKGGFGHIGITVPNVYDFCQMIYDKHGGDIFKKSPNAGGMKGLAFIKDPDGYLIEIIANRPQELREVDCLGNKVNEGTYVDNSKI